MGNENLIDLLNDLININNDRIEGYEKAIEELDDQRPQHERGLFEERIQESRVLHNELASAVSRLGGKLQDDTTTGGKLYRLWMDMKTTFTGGSSKSVLELCEYGEDVALKAYNKALAEKVNWPEDILTMLTRQRQILKEAHDLIKRYRDSQKKVEV